MACGTNAGPLIDFDIPFIKVPTAVGIMDANGGLYLCVGTVENPGCAVQVGRMTGMMVDTSKLEELQAHVENLNTEITELTALLSKKTLTVGDVVDTLRLETVAH